MAKRQNLLNNSFDFSNSSIFDAFSMELGFEMFQTDFAPVETIWSLPTKTTYQTSDVVSAAPPAVFELSSLLASNGGNGSAGFVINGIDVDDQSGFSVSSAGDFNGDGFDDIIIGALTADPNGNSGAGESYIVFGSGAGFVASLDLSTLNGTNGFVINGIDQGDSSGRSVSAAGDINGDGFDDIIIGTVRADPNGIDSAGESYVVFGSGSGFSASLDLSSLNGTNGFVINGIDILDFSGWSVSSAGDINGDGFDDVIIGARLGTPNGTTNAGESYVVFGSGSGFSASLDLSSLNGTNGFVINGIDVGDQSGFSVSGAGDINGDGFDDIIIGAKFGDPNGNSGAGESYIVFGSGAGFAASFDLSTLNGTNGFVINGIDVGDQSGGSVSAAGDINGDGFDDIIIGAPSADPNGKSNAGESYIVFGSGSGFSASLDLSTLNGTNGFVINGIDSAGRRSGDLSGTSVSSAGDFNGDGFDDIIIGARSADPHGNSSAGESYIVFGSGSGFAASLDLSTLNGTNGFVINGIDSSDVSGNSVSAAGDINGDGFDDIIISGHSADPNGNSAAGESYIIFGSASYGPPPPPPAVFELSSLLAANGGNGSAGFVIIGIDADDFSGWSVSGAGDINGDGFDDIIIGAEFAGPNGNIYAGESYIVFGSGSGFSASFDLSSLNGTNGFVINGIDASDNSGGSVSAAGDVNGDGYDDIIIGAPSADPNGKSTAGESYIVFGSGAGFAASFDLSSLNGTNGFVINGIDANDQSGTSISSAGDVNGDGFDDLLIGASSGDPNGNSNAGESYVVFGSGSGFSASLDLSTLNGTNGFVINGIDASDSSGRSISAAGDINGDGFDDIIIGASGGDPNGNSSAGESYIVFGSGAGFAASLDLSSLNGTNGFVINGIDALDFSGLSVSGAGDINGDGFDDIIIGAPFADPNGNGNAGESYIVFGSGTGFAASIDLSSLNGTNGFVINGIDVSDQSGFSVSAAGDINGDGFDDIIIGALSADPNGNNGAGESYVVFGSGAGFAASLDLSSLNGTNGFVINGIDADDNSGYSVSGAGDINGDGFDDLLIGARSADPNGNSSAGESYIIFGSASYGPPQPNAAPVTANLEAAALNYQETGGAQAISASLTLTDSDDTNLESATISITTGFDAANDSLIFVDQNGITGVYTAATGVLVLTGSSSIANYQAALRSITYLNGFNTVSIAQRVLSIVVNDGDDNSVTVTRNIDIVTDETIAGTGGADNIRGRLGDDIINGGTGNDRLVGGVGDDTLNGGDDNDLLLGQDGVDTLNGDAGNDRLVAGDGDDILNGGTGDDRLWGGAGADAMDGGDGIDRAVYDTAPAGVVASLLTGGTGGDAAGDTYVNIEDLFGSNFADTLTGDAEDNTILGLDGDDIMDGGAGNDRLVGGIGNDTLTGGDGNDILVGQSGDDAFNGDEGADRLFGGDGNDTLIAGNGDDYLAGGADNDRLTGGNGADKLIGGTGADVFVFDFDVAASGLDTIFDFETGVDKIELNGTLLTYADLTFTVSPNGQHTTISFNGHSIYVKNTIPAQLDAAQFTFIDPSPAEVPDTGKALVSEDVSEVGKLIISDDDSFQFVEKSIVSDDILSGSANFGDFAVSQDVLAEFLSYAETQREIFVGAEGAIEDGYDGNLSYFTEFFDFI